MTITFSYPNLQDRRIKALRRLRSEYNYASDPDATSSALEGWLLVIEKYSSKVNEYFNSAEWGYLADMSLDFNGYWNAPASELGKMMASWCKYFSEQPESKRHFGIDHKRLERTLFHLEALDAAFVMMAIIWYWTAAPGDVPAGSPWWTQEYRSTMNILIQQRRKTYEPKVGPTATKEPHQRMRYKNSYRKRKQKKEEERIKTLALEMLKTIQSQPQPIIDQDKLS